MNKITFNSESYVLKDLLLAFDKFGAIVVKKAIKVNKINALADTVKLLIDKRLKNLGVKASNTLDESFYKLEKLGNEYVSQLFVAIRQTPELYKLVFSEDALKIVSQLMPQTQLQIPVESCGIRADSRIGKVRSFHWHQDYPYNTLSKRALTGWIPFAPLIKKWVTFVLSWDLIKPLSLYYLMYKAASQSFKGHQIYHLANLTNEELELRSIELDDIIIGDMLVIDTRLLHRSGKNVSNRVRWTALPRYGDALAEEVIERGWQTIRSDKGVRLFGELHPELINIPNK